MNTLLGAASELSDTEMTVAISHLQDMRAARAVEFAKSAASAPPKKVIEGLGHRFGLSNAEAREMHAQVLVKRKNAQLAKFFTERAYSMAVVSVLLNLVRMIEFDGKKTKSGMITRKQLDFMLRHLLGTPTDETPQQAINRISSAMKKENKFLAFEAAQRKHEEYEKNKAAFYAAHPELEPIDAVKPKVKKVEGEKPAAAVFDGPVELPKAKPELKPPLEMPKPGESPLLDESELQEPGCLADDADVRFNVKKTGPNQNTLTLSGVSDVDTAVIQRAVGSQINAIPDKEMSRDNKRNIGRAAIMALRNHISTDQRFAKVTVNLVVDTETLRDNGEPIIHMEGKEYTGRQIVEIADKWSIAEALIVVDAHGTVVSHNSGRLADSAMRGMMSTMQVCCGFPGCETTINLQAHHIHPFGSGGKTELGNMVLLCPHCHAKVTGKEERFMVFHDLGTSVWLNEYDDYYVGIMAAPSSTLMTRLGKQHELDSLNPYDFVKLCRILIRETWKRLNQMKHAEGA
ncbi:MAG: HNH endonuclease [Corynebacterium sp.]|nr:HNH endonuclease [Corynebacterium sp.]